MTHALSSAVMRFSPRARGCSQHRGVLHAFLQVFPACAGMFRWLTNGPMLSWGFPRVRGYVPCPACLRKQMSRFSPRARGCSCVGRNGFTINFVFPACAGMFLLSAIDRELQSCFPRVRGDVPKPEADAPAVVVFSPRTRGCSGVVVAAGPASGIFPACAGMFLTASGSVTA